MSLDITAGAKSSAPLPLQFLNIELTPLVGGEFAVNMQATLLDEEALQFVGQDIAYERVATLDEALAVIRQNAGVLAAAS